MSIQVPRSHISLRVQAAGRQDEGKRPLRKAASIWEDNTSRTNGKVHLSQCAPCRQDASVKLQLHSLLHSAKGGFSGQLQALGTFTSQGKHWYPLQRKRSGHRNRSGRFQRQQALLLLLGIEPRLGGILAHSPVTIPTVLSWLRVILELLANTT